MRTLTLNVAGKTCEELYFFYVERALDAEVRWVWETKEYHTLFTHYPTMVEFDAKSSLMQGPTRVHASSFRNTLFFR